MPRTIWSVLFVMLLQPFATQANDELLRLQTDPGQWVMQRKDYAATGYSEISQITAENVKHLKAAWTFSTGVLRGHELGSIDIALKKARTARFFDMPTGELGKLSQPGGSLYNIEHANGGLITFPGGVPIRDRDGMIIGAVGVSGSTVENDHAVAEAGAKAALT